MTDSPLVSILSPCYNVEKFLPQCLDSIINQTYSNLQIVLIDDGSKDATWHMMQDYAGKDSRIEIYHQENQGVSATRNYLLEKVKGDYVLFVDSDDWIEPNMVEFLLGKSLTNNAEMVVCGNVINDMAPASEYTEELWSQDTAVREFLRHVSFNGSLCNKLIKVSLFHNEPRFHRGISYGEDALFMWHLLQNVNRVVVTTEQLYHYRTNERSLSHCTYDHRKMSGHLVWEIINKEAVTLWPQYKNVADATFAISDMWQLYYALKSKYPKDDNIEKFQKHVRDNLRLIHRSGLVNRKKIFFAFLVAYNYRLAGMII